MQFEPENPAMEEEKKPYQTPRLIQHGTVEQITGIDSDADDSIGGPSGFTDDAGEIIRFDG